MSSIKLSPNASGTGEFTIAAPNSNTNRTLNLPDASGTILTNSGTEAGAFSTLAVAGNNISAVNGINFRNRIINGDMVIDQRNAGASFTSSGNQYCLDRWLLQAVGATNTAQQVTGSTGNNKAVRITGNTGNTITGFSQRIESWNILDCASQSVTVSFTLSGSTSGSVSIRRLYPTATDNYTSTTEPDSGVTVAFTTTATRYTATFTLSSNANKGLWLYFDFGAVGSGVTRTLEDIQLEAGSVATPFERLPYGTELALCQRYFEMWQGNGYTSVGFGGASTTNGVDAGFVFKVTKRAAPTLTYSAVGDFMISSGNFGTPQTCTTLGILTATFDSTYLQGRCAGTPFTVGNNGVISSNNTTNAKLFFSSEL